MREKQTFSIGDRVKYYFNYGNYLLVETGIIYTIYDSCCYLTKLCYGVERDSNKFHDFGYAEDFKSI